MERRIDEEKVEEGKEFETILEYARLESWVFVTYEIVERLEKKYENYPYRCSGKEGTIFEIDKEGERWSMHIDWDLTWNKVSLISQEDVPFDKRPRLLSDNPEVIVLLS